MTIPQTREYLNRGYIGRGRSTSRDVTFTCLNSDAYDANDVLTDPVQIQNAVAEEGGTAILTDILILDKDDQTAAAMDVYIFDSSRSMGAKDAAISISDVDATNIIGVVAIAAADWKDLINSKLAHIKNINIVVSAALDSRSLYAQLVTAGTPTQSTNGITGKFKFIQD